MILEASNEVACSADPGRVVVGSLSEQRKFYRWINVHRRVKFMYVRTIKQVQYEVYPKFRNLFRKMTVPFASPPGISRIFGKRPKSYSFDPVGPYSVAAFIALPLNVKGQMDVGFLGYSLASYCRVL